MQRQIGQRRFIIRVPEVVFTLKERERVKVILYTLSILQKTHLCFSLELAIISYFTTLVNQIGQIELILRAVAFTVAELPDQYLAIYNDEKTPNSLK